MRRQSYLPRAEAPWAKAAAYALSTGVTFAFVMLSFVITKEPDLASVGRTYRTLFFGWW